MYSSFSGRLMSFNFLQLLKAQDDIFLSVDGNFIFYNALSPKTPYSSLLLPIYPFVPSTSSPSFKTTDRSNWLLAKVLYSTSLTVFEKVIVLMSFAPRTIHDMFLLNPVSETKSHRSCQFVLYITMFLGSVYLLLPESLSY